MSAAPMPPDGIDACRPGWPVRQRVLGLLFAGLLAALLLLPFLRIAPNRLLSGQGVSLLALADGIWLWLAVPMLWLAAAVWLRPRRGIAVLTVLAALLLAGGLAALAGAEAQRQAQLLSPLARVSLSSGFWLALLLLWAIAGDAGQRAAPGRLPGAIVLLGPLLLLAGGALDQLSLLKEHANRSDVFADALLRHLQLVASSLLPALAIGLPLGVAAARRAGLARPMFVLLNLIQTLPSIALFGLLIGPLAWLGQALPDSGIRGIGLLPAVIALTLYALLPVVHGMTSGLQQIGSGVLEAAAAMGLSRRQRFWQVELPLALPVLLAAVRLTTVQLIGLAVVAALIGAGGLGALVFQGLLGSALDLVLLGVIPVLAIALAVDAVFALLQRRIGSGATR